jgi:hypothetical protein
MTTAKITQPCPECEAPFRFTLDDAAKGRTVTCSSGHAITLNDKTGDAGRAQKAHDDLMDQLKDLGK